MRQPSVAPELLSPAGSLRAMRLAFAYGADAVYAGLPRMSLRVRNNRFDPETMDQGIREAHDLGKRFYAVTNVAPHMAGPPALSRDTHAYIGPGQYGQPGGGEVLAGTGGEQLARLGVHSLKIEGRTKSPYYVARTAQVYRRAIDDAVSGQPFDPGLLFELEGLANRGYTAGLLDRHARPETLQNLERAHHHGAQQWVAEPAPR